jgi:hypothetical protein
MVQFYQVGPDLLTDEYDLSYVKDDYVWFVYFYSNGGYDGCGEAVALGKDGFLHCLDLSHCSCYGPMENWATKTSKVTVEEYMTPSESAFDPVAMEAVMAKVKELLQWTEPVFDEKFDFLS